MSHYVKGDPYWITVRYPAVCSCGTKVSKGEQGFYWPKGRKVECAKCGAKSERRFIVETSFEAWS